MTATAIDLLDNLQSRGVRVKIEGDKLKLDGPTGALSPELKSHLADLKPEIISLLSAPSSPAEPEPCPACGSPLISRPGRRYTHVFCPGGCFSTWRDQEPWPRINEDGDLVVPLTAPARYRYWASGQALVETLAELGAPLETWRRYADRLTGDHSNVCNGEIRRSGAVRYCAECRRFQEAG